MRSLSLAFVESCAVRIESHRIALARARSLAHFVMRVAAETAATAIERFETPFISRWRPSMHFKAQVCEHAGRILYAIARSSTRARVRERNLTPH